LLLIGLSKKLIFTDEAAEIADPVFAAVAAGHAIGAEQAWIGLSAFTVQIYFDFAAYSDIAIGVGALFGIVLPENFNAPYRACSIAQFWRCWHITLSTFLRDYLYIPLGGLWHGAAWGGVHGMALVVVHLWRRYALPCPTLLGWLLTSAVVMLAWVLFRAADFATAQRFYTALLRGGVAESAMHVIRDLHSPLILAIAMAFAIAGPTSQTVALVLLPAQRSVAIAASLSMAIVVLMAGALGSQEFICF
jgi:alginate O-acetyltransferase complex protein AlgI